MHAPKVGSPTRSAAFQVLTSPPLGEEYEKFSEKMHKLLARTLHTSSTMAVELAEMAKTVIALTSLDSLEREKVYIHLQRAYEKYQHQTVEASYLIHCVRALDLITRLESVLESSSKEIKDLYRDHRIGIGYPLTLEDPSAFLQVVSSQDAYKTAVTALKKSINDSLSKFAIDPHLTIEISEMQKIVERSQIEILGFTAVAKWFSSQEDVACFFSRPWENLNPKYKCAKLERDLQSFFTPPVLDIFQALYEELEVANFVLNKLACYKLPLTGYPHAA